jgi:hypothetical protein
MMNLPFPGVPVVSQPSIITSPRMIAATIGLDCYHGHFFAFFSGPDGLLLI